MTDMPDVIAYIAARATAQDIDIIFDAAKARHRALRTIRAAGVGVGDTVVFIGISPKALNGLCGVVQSHNGKHADVLLDLASTRRLAASRTRYAIRAAGATEYLMSGVPLSCCDTGR